MLKLLVYLLNELLSETIDYKGILILSNLLWMYHKKLAKQLNIDTSRGGWFLNLVNKDLFYIDLQRGGVDIVKDLLSEGKKNNISLPDIYRMELEKLHKILSDALNSK